MTSRDFLLLLARRWYVIALALLLAAGLTLHFARDGGVFYSRTTIVFTLPGTNTLQPFNGSNYSSVITFAQTVAARANGGDTDPRYYSRSDAPLYGAGLREAVVIGVQDDGSQWSSSLSSATIQVQIVGRTEQWVADEQRAAIAAIEAIAKDGQLAANVPEGARIDVHVEPLSMGIDHIVPSRLAQASAGLAMGLVAVLVGGAAAWAMDRPRRHSRRRREPRVRRQVGADVA